MKVLLLNPPNIDSQYINRDLMGGLGVNITYRHKLAEKLLSYLKAHSIRLPVMSMVYSASVLARHHDVAVIDAANLELSIDETLKRVADEKPDWVLSTTSISALMEEAKLLGRIKEKVGATIGLMGDAATILSNEVMKKYPVDFIIKGDEPEFVIEKIIEAGGYKNISGVIHRDNGSVRDCGDPPTIMDLDSLPFPRWDLFPIHAYRYFPILRKTPFVPVLSTRGCPYGCIYCPYTSNQGLKYRYRSAQNVIDELVQIKTQHGIRAVQFRDPTFTLKKDRTAEICEGMIRNKLNLEWGCETRVDCLNEELIDRMVAAGLKGLNMGVESSDPEVIRNVKRGWIDPNHMRKMVEHLTRNGVRVAGFFILGLPGETRKTVQQTLELAVKLPLSYAEFKIATPFPGTPLFELAKKNNWIQDVQIEQYTSYTPSMRISDELDPDFLTASANRAYQSFYLRPTKILREVLSDSFFANMMGILLKN